jgi:Phage tail tube protein
VANLMDNQIGLKKESVYNTPVTVDRFYPYLDGTAGDWNTRQRQGQSIFVSTKRGMRGDRRVLPIGQGVITIKTELASKQGGVLLDLCHGVSTVTAITGGTQQNYTTAIPGTVLPSATIQLGKVRNDGTVDVETYSGCTAVSFELECPEDGILTISVTFDARAFTTATALAIAGYTAGAFLFDASQGSATLGGAFTAPTTTVLGTATTAFANFRSWKLAVDQSADIGRWVLGSRNQPTVGMISPTFSGDAEYNDTVLRTAYLAGTGIPVVITHTTPEVVAPGFSQFSLAIPQLFLSAPILPPMGADTSVVSITGDVTYNGALDLFFTTIRTADIAL